MSGGDFWSRRKARVEAEEAEAEAARARSEVEAAEAALAEKSDAEICADLDLPDPDTLGPGDDVRAFMAQAVPDRLRRRALRQLWRTNPTLANLDKLVDYGEDFTDSALAVANIQTAYQVGRGIVRKVETALETAGDPPEEQAAGPERGDDAADAPDPSEVAMAPPVDPAPAAALSTARDNSPSDATGESGDAGDLPEGAPAPRRMRFAFATPRSDQETR